MTETQTQSRRFGLTLAGLIFVSDQALKWIILNVVDLAARGRIEITSFFDLVLVWNRGISYGLFQQQGMGRWVLVAVSVVAIVAIWIWLARLPGRLNALALGLLLGGAAGNLVDRIIFGAVVDFVSLHWAGFYWYVFNIADATIVAGVAVLLYNSFVPGHSRAANGD